MKAVDPEDGIFIAIADALKLAALGETHHTSDAECA
jgi:hypothetical protein